MLRCGMIGTERNEGRPLQAGEIEKGGREKAGPSSNSDIEVNPEQAAGHHEQCQALSPHSCQQPQEPEYPDTAEVACCCH